MFHSLQYFYTASSGVSNLPEFVVVGSVDGVQVVHYDSETRRAEPRQNWMNKVTLKDPQYWENQTAALINIQRVFRDNAETAGQRFNQTGGLFRLKLRNLVFSVHSSRFRCFCLCGEMKLWIDSGLVFVSGVHIVQEMYGCEWDDETEQVYGFHQYGYDGEDFISLDLKTMTWIAPRPQAVLTKNKWDGDTAWVTQTHQYLNKECISWLRKYLDHGSNFLLRTGTAGAMPQLQLV